MNDEVGPLMFETFLPAALAEKRYLAAPEPEVIGHGLGAIQQGFEVQRRGVSARKVVISVGGEPEPPTRSTFQVSREEMRNPQEGG